jgi:hypothetical protein
MKQLLSLILAVLLVGGVASSVATGAVAGFSDTEVSTDNEMCGGSLLIRFIGERIEIEDAWPCDWFEAEMEVVNCGTRDGIAYLKLENIEGIEDALGSAVTAEPEHVGELGGIAGEDADGNPVSVPGLGQDICDLYNHVDIEIWYDKDGDGVFERDGDGDCDCGCGCDGDELIYAGKLGKWPTCHKEKLGKLYAATQINGGWGTYFAYHTGDGTEADPVLAPFTANQNDKVGWVSIWNDSANLYVDYDTRDTTCWKICETHVYAGEGTPPPHGWGQFPYGADHPYIDIKEECHVQYHIPLGELGADPTCTWLNIAAHAQGGRCCQDTGWAMRGPPRKLLIRLHAQDFDEEDAFAQGLIPTTYFDETYPEAKWDHWPTNAYMGDICQFDMKFTMNQDCCYRHWRYYGGTGWTYNCYHW